MDYLAWQTFPFSVTNPEPWNCTWLCVCMSATTDVLIDKPWLKPDTPTKPRSCHWCERVMIAHINKPRAKLIGLNLEWWRLFTPQCNPPTPKCSSCAFMHVLIISHQDQRKYFKYDIAIQYNKVWTITYFMDHKWEANARLAETQRNATVQWSRPCN